MQKHYFFVSWDEDLHTAAAKKRIEEKLGIEVHLVSTNTLTFRDGLTFYDSENVESQLLPQCKSGDVVWARRIRPFQKSRSEIPRGAEEDAFVHNAFNHAFMGALSACQSRNVVNDIWLQQKADIKILQLNAAAREGFKIPDTIVSNAPRSVREFFARHHGKVIAKAISGTRYNTYVTVALSDDILEDDAGIIACPAIYQEMVEGNRHLRVNFFGDNAYAFEIESDIVDWRRKLTRNIRHVDLSPSLISGLGRIKTIGDALTLFDSRSIVDFLDVADGRHTLIPAAGQDRYVVLTQQALADGIMDAALLQLYEVRAPREAKRHDDCIAYQQRKIDRALKAFSERPPGQGATQPMIGEIALASALGYLSLRFEGRWRADHSKLVTWLEDFARRFSAYEATMPY
ncbi:glutathione S-transferase C-terminal domain-containing protein [Caballeronia sp. AZ10_KS36]|uniref:glutathione S-transferase C-terminal domain-containing protein n=1 Tax=Caballeronia sp. AZ10_KS36 TaxID=2921757 RepID=UPI0020294AA3|nr:glutathione S-transferase C-terminal domain-containing protein [Caballeronia sp. AZ10_KS36]